MITEAARRIYVRFPHDPVTDFLSWCGPIVAFPTELMTRIDISYVVIVRKAATDSGYTVELQVKNPSEENYGYPFRFNNLEGLWNMLIFVAYRDFMTRSSDRFLISTTVLDSTSSHADESYIRHSTRAIDGYSSTVTDSEVGLIPSWTTDRIDPSMLRVRHASDFPKCDFSQLLNRYDRVSFVADGDGLTLRVGESRKHFKWLDSVHIFLEDRPRLED